MRNIFKFTAAAGVAAALTATVALAPGTASAHHWHDRGPSDLTLADVLLADSAGDDADGFDHNWFDFDIVTQAVLLFPDLVDAASNPDADLTVLLPSDWAFRKLVKDIAGVRLHDEAEVFDAVAGLGVDTVRDVLLYHIVPARISYRDALRSEGAVIPTLLADATLEVDVRRHYWRQKVKLIDADTTDQNPTVRWPDLGGGEHLNGYAHGLNRVLRPIDLP